MYLDRGCLVVSIWGWRAVRVALITVGKRKGDKGYHVLPGEYQVETFTEKKTRKPLRKGLGI